MSDFRMLSLNVRGLSNFKKRVIFAWCRKKNANIIFLQETHSTGNNEKQWKADWGAPLEVAHGSSNSRGVAILFRKGFDCKIIKKVIDPNGRYISIEVQINDEKYFLVNVYGEEVEKILDECKADLENFYEEKANGLIVRARARWHEYGEKSTKYFLSLEKRNYTRKHIRKLCLSGVITKNYKKILDSASEYYKNLYSSKLKVDHSDSLHHFLGNSNIPRLSQEERLSCEGQITIEEFVKALDTFDTGKTPGNDGIPAEFYKIFWNSVGKLMTEVFNHSLELGQISNSQKQAITTLIDKKGRDRMFLENWSPISLINVDSKIATKVIANRIKNVLPSVIHANQSGFMKGRFIGETARSILDIIAHTESLQLPGVLLFIDFEKAFDSIEHEFLYKALECFNFGPSFIKWIQTFYNNLSSCVLNNGFFSSPFQLERGVRQGDPLSPYLFLIAIEIMAISIRTNENIEGIKIGEDETRSLLYADDMTATLANISSVEKMINLWKLRGLSLFGKVAIIKSS